jgi:predicted nucleic acid-binding protein
MPFLVDSNVLSEVTKPDPDTGVVIWLKDHEEEIAVDPIIIGELRTGILCLPSGARRKRLEEWFQRVSGSLHCLSWDFDTGMRWAQLLADLRRAGRAMPLKDSLIAASALQHGLTVATRNEQDFLKAGVRLFNPFSG